MRRIGYFYGLIFLLSLLPWGLSATVLPSLHGRVNDEAQVLGDRAQAIEAKLAAHESSTGDQVVVLVVPSLQGQDIESYANGVFTHWKLGRQGVDNGVLMVVSTGDRQARIEVGYGLEGTLTDLASSQILRYRMHPYFARGDYAAGVEAGVDGILGVLDGDNSVPVSHSTETSQQILQRDGFWRSGEWIVVVFVGSFCLVFGLLAGLGGSWWSYFLLGPICIPLLLIFYSWHIVLVLLALDLALIGGWRWRLMRKAFERLSKTDTEANGLRQWPPTLWQVVLWRGLPASNSSRSSGGNGYSGINSSSSSSSDSSGFTSSSSSDYSGGGGESGGGGASDSW